VKSRLPAVRRRRSLCTMQDVNDHPLAHVQGAAMAASVDLSVRSDLQAAAPDPVEVFLGQPVTITRLTEHKVPKSEEGLRMLAADGSWRAVAALAEHLLGESHPIDELLRIRWYRIVALLKARDVQQAEREFALLGDLYGPSWTYERYPGMFPMRKGSMVPFAMLLLQALLPSYGGDNNTSLTRLYELLSRTETQLRETSDPKSVRLLNIERQKTILALINIFGAVGDLPVAIAHLEKLLNEVDELCPPLGEESVKKDPPALVATISSAGPTIIARGRPAAKSELLSLLGRIHIQVGDVKSAEATFQQMEALIPADTPDLAQQVMVHLNRGLLQVAHGDYESALHEFTCVRRLDGANVAAANNCAVCHLFCERLSDAVATLEDFVRANPGAHLQQAVAANMAALYQMVEGGAEMMQTLEKLVFAVASDDFDTSVLQLRPS